MIALPAIAYAGRPFFRSARRALRAGHTNKDVPISLAVLLVPAMSLVETIRGGCHTLQDLAARTGAGTGCGSCRGQLAALLLRTQKGRAAIP